MTISILMPVYNGAATLAQTLGTIEAQTDPDWELIVVDDGSDDCTAAMLQEAAARDPRIRPLYPGRQGIVGALNAGLASCRGDYIARMDADDLMTPERLALQRAYLDGHPHVGLVSGQVIYDGDPERFKGLCLYTEWVNSLTTAEQIEQNRFVESPLIHPSVMCRKEILMGMGGYRDGPFPEDYELWLRMLASGVRMGKVAAPVVHWCERSDRLTRTDSRYSVEAFYRIKTQYLAAYLHEREIHRVHVWGAGRVSRQRAELLCDHQIIIDAYIDIDPKKVGQVIKGRPVLDKEQIPPAGDAFVLAYVGSRGARDLIAQYLREKGFRTGVHFLLAA